MLHVVIPSPAYVNLPELGQIALYIRHATGVDTDHAGLEEFGRDHVPTVPDDLPDLPVDVEAHPATRCRVIASVTVATRCPRQSKIVTGGILEPTAP